jgi:[ribosomal protein S5]-alanine N-acetyltransferase
MSGGADRPRGTEPFEPPTLVGARVHLRSYREADFEAFLALHADPVVMRYWSSPPVDDVDEARRRFESRRSDNAPDRQLSWVIAGNDDDEMLGRADLFAIDVEQGRAETGYALAAAHWGRGHAREALQLLLGHAFGTLALRRVEADTDPRNRASCRLLERLGFVREGLLRQRWIVDGEVSDSALYGLLREDFARAAPALVTRAP